MKKNMVITTLKPKKVVYATILTLAALLFSLNVSAQQNPSPNGRNTNLVDFGTFDGRLLGTFIQMNTQTWVERHENGTPSFSFNERGRDDWSVYLFDSSRNVSLQLDLHTRKIMYSDANSPQSRELYQVRNASA